MADADVAGLDRGREALRRFLVGDDDLNAMLTKITLIAVETVDGCDFASITMLRRGQPTTPVFSHKTALVLDETQYALGDGPCLSAMRHRGVEQVRTQSDERWPTFSAAAVELGVLATLSVPLVDGEEAPGALNMYSTAPPGYSEDAQRVAAVFADQIGLAAARAAVYVNGLELARQLQEAMQSRAVIEQAKGILMAAQKLTPDMAFDILRRASQGQNRKLREIASEIVARYTERGSGPTAPLQ